MAFTGTIITEAKLAFYEGANLAAGGITADARDTWVLTAEAFLSALVEFDIVGSWATINALTRTLFTDYAGHYGAVMGIQFDMASITTATSRIEAEDRINIHLEKMREIVKTLSNQSIQDFMGV